MAAPATASPADPEELDELELEEELLDEELVDEELELDEEELEVLELDDELDELDCGSSVPPQPYNTVAASIRNRCLYMDDLHLDLILQFSTAGYPDSGYLASFGPLNCE